MTNNRRAIISALAVAACVLVVVSSAAWATPIDLGAAGPSFWGILETGAGQVSLSGPTEGIFGSSTQANLGIAEGGKLNSSGTTTIQGAYYKYSTNTGDSISQTTIVGGTLQGSAVDSLLAQAVLDATAADLFAASLACTMGAACGSTLTSSTTFTGVTGLNVLVVNGINLGNGEIVTLSGPAGASFLIFDLGGLTLNSGQIRVAGGVTPLDVLIDVKGGTASASGGLNNESVIDGILMNLTGKIQFSPGAVNGEVIGGYDISFVSGASVHVPPIPAVPEPGTFLLLGSGLAGLGGMAWRQHRRK